MDNQIMTFEITSKQIKYKDIFNKDFLELEVYAISDVNPNRNRTHFTLESMKNALESFKNKPILGFFNKGDFEQHNGSVGYDAETGEQYWDTEKGERILGVIRESDSVEIVEKDGLNWIKLRCAIWVQYCYKQVRKILKDRNKKVSVEIMVTKKEDREDGIEDILEFNLRGITILGSKNGKPILEGIQGAHLSLLDALEDENFKEQKKVLSFAYQQIDEYNGVKSSNINVEETEKEVKTVEENKPEKEEEEVKETSNSNEESSNSCGEEEKSYEENCPCAEDPQAEDQEADVPANVAEATEEEMAAEPVQEEENSNEESEAKNEEDYASLNEKYNEVVTKCENFASEIEEYKTRCENFASEIEEYKIKISEYEEKQRLFADYEGIKARMFAAEEKVQQFICRELTMKAEEMIKNEKINEEDIINIKEKCQKGEYKCVDDIKKDVAYAIYTARPAQNNQRYATGINFEENPVENKNKNTMSREERIAARIGK